MKPLELNKVYDTVNKGYDVAEPNKQIISSNPIQSITKHTIIHHNQCDTFSSDSCIIRQTIMNCYLTWNGEISLPPFPLCSNVFIVLLLFRSSHNKTYHQQKAEAFANSALFSLQF